MTRKEHRRAIKTGKCRKLISKLGLKGLYITVQTKRVYHRTKCLYKKYSPSLHTIVKQNPTEHRSTKQKLSIFKTQF